MGIQLTALLRQFDAACAAADELAQAAIAHFDQHPDAQIITSYPGLRRLPAPGCWPRSVTTAPASLTPADSKPSPDPPRSPAPAARKPWCCTGISRTADWPPSARPGPWDRCAPRRAPAATTTPAAPLETGTTKPNDICSTSSLANSTTAYRPASPTTNTGRPTLTLRRSLEGIAEDDAGSVRAPERANDSLSIINPVRVRPDVFGASAVNERSK
jgi:hypothetical protein